MYVTIKSYLKTNSANHLDHIFSKINERIEESNGNKYLSPVPTDVSKEILKKYEEMWDKIRNFIRSITNNSDDHYKKYVKIKRNWDDDLPLNKTIKFCSMVIIVRSVFHEDNRHYPQVFLNEYFYKL